MANSFKVIKLKTMGNKRSKPLPVSLEQLPVDCKNIVHSYLVETQQGLRERLYCVQLAARQIKRGEFLEMFDDLEIDSDSQEAFDVCYNRELTHIRLPNGNLVFVN